VADAQGSGAIQNDDVTVTQIHDIQGPGATSPIVGTTTVTRGIVTGLRTNGFFLQAPDAEADLNSLTSEGVFVFTSSAPPAAAAVGNRVQVAGTVSEFIPSQDPFSPPVTELTSPTVTLLSTSNALPAPIALTNSLPVASGAIDQLERLEGMRVSVSTMTVVAPTAGSVNEPNAAGVSDGVFFGVVAGTARPFREPGIVQPDPVPAGAGANVPRFDANAELIRVDSNGLVGQATVEVTTGATVSNLTGPLDFSFRYYTILPDSTPVISGNTTFTAVPAPGGNQFTVASTNVERFFDTVNDPAIGEPVLTTTAFNNRLNKASLTIRNVLRSPDIIAVEEMEDLVTLQALADKVNGDAVAASQPNPGYTAYLVEGNDVGGIDVGFLIKSSRVNVVAVTQFGKTTLFANPDASTELLNDRPPLVLRATVSGQAITVIVNHLRSLNGVDDTAAGSNGWPTGGQRVRAKRKAQAEFLANLIQTRQTADPTERILVVGDFNAFQFNDGFVDVVGTVQGTPTPADQVTLATADLVNPNLSNLVDTLPTNQRYSYVFDGSAQVLDQMLANAPLMSMFGGYAFGRSNADFPETYRSDSTRPERLSDHDVPVAYFNLPSTGPVDVTSQLTIARTGLIFSRVTGTYNQNVTITNKTAQPLNGPLHVQFRNLSSGVTLANGSGTAVDGPYLTIPAISSLAPGASATVAVRFANPINAIIGYTLVVLSGSF
jgi:predicted extracellular nuclease